MSISPGDLKKQIVRSHYIYYEIEKWRKWVYSRILPLYQDDPGFALYKNKFFMIPRKTSSKIFYSLFFKGSKDITLIEKKYSSIFKLPKKVRVKYFTRFFFVS